MYYGHGSTIALLVFFGFIALRVIASQRRRQGRPGVTRARAFTDTSVASQPDGAGGSSDAAGVPFTGIAPGWMIDPTGRHEQRYWSGTAWTEHVLDRGVPATDPPPPGSGPDAS
jgi:uncharacterized protein DUF2510